MSPLKSCNSSILARDKATTLKYLNVKTRKKWKEKKRSLLEMGGLKKSDSCKVFYEVFYDLRVFRPKLLLDLSG